MTHASHDFSELALHEPPPATSLEDLPLVHPSLPLRRPVDCDLHAEGVARLSGREGLREEEGEGALGDGGVPERSKEISAALEREDSRAGCCRRTWGCRG